MPSHILRTLTVLAALMPAAAMAQSDVAGFQSPSGNIHCQFFKGDSETDTAIRCDAMQMVVTASRPRDCDLEWGRAFEIGAKGQRGTRLCYGDTVMDTRLPKLGYGEVWQRAGFTCTSEQTGISCFNAARHGFTLSRATQTLF